jgi:hypothetical protein
VTLLSTETFDFTYRDALDPYRGQRFSNVVQLEGFDDCSDHLHEFFSLSMAEIG